MEKGVAQYRTEDFRVFLAPPYFSADLEHEVAWHRKHLAMLHHHKQNPHLFHRQFTAGPITPDRIKDYEEQVLNSIPFHQKILHEQQHRLTAILGLLPKRRYKKIVGISRKNGVVAPYFIYDKRRKKSFFLIEHEAPHLRAWAAEAKKVIPIIELPREVSA